MDEVFDLKEFIIIVLRKWKIVLTFALVCCALGGTYKVAPILVGNPKNGAEQSSFVQAKYQEALGAYKTQKTSIQIQIDSIKSKQNELAKYNANSLMMKVNPYNVNIAEVDLYVNTNYKVLPGMTYQTPDYVAQLLCAYSLLVQNGSMYDSMAKDLNLDTEQRYLKEIINVSYDLNSNVLSVRVLSPNTQMSLNIKDYIYQYILKSKNQLADTIGKHSLQVISNSSYVSVDMGIYTSQKTNLAQGAELTKTLSEKQDELKSLQQPDETTFSSNNQLTFSGSAKSVIKFMFLGFLGGILLGILLILFVDVFNNSIQNDYEIKKKFKLKYLGRIPNNKKRSVK